MQAWQYYFKNMIELFLFCVLIVSIYDKTPKSVMLVSSEIFRVLGLLGFLFDARLLFLWHQTVHFFGSSIVEGVSEERHLFGVC